MQWCTLLELHVNYEVLFTSFGLCLHKGSLTMTRFEPSHFMFPEISETFLKRTFLYWHH